MEGSESGVDTGMEADSGSLDAGPDHGDGGSATDASPSDAGQRPSAAELQQWIDDYKSTHSGNGGKDWDIIGCCGGASRTEQELQNDADAVRLRSICGPGQLPVIPQLAWEYGGNDHQWINPGASALAYCVYIPAPPGASHWQYDANTDHVNADLYVLYPEQNPCRDQVGKFKVMACLGDASNIEILVDTASLHDGADVGLNLSESTTDLHLLVDGDRVLMYQGL